MSFFNKIKNVFSDKKQSKNSENLLNGRIFVEKPNDDIDFFKKAKEIVENSNESFLNENLKTLIKLSDSEIIKNVFYRIRKELYTVDYVEELDNNIQTNLITLRFYLLNPIFKKTKNKRLARLFMIFFNIAPELMKGKKNRNKVNLLSFSGDEDVNDIISDLSLFNLSDNEIKYTASKIVEFNRQNVAYTNEEIIFLNNSETLRLFLEKLSSILHNFIQTISQWENYFISENLGLNEYKKNILNIDKKLIFGNKFYMTFFDLIMDKNINEELKPLIDKKFEELFDKDLNFVISSIKNKILKEHKNLIFNFEKILAWSIVLLKELDELPPQNVISSLIAKSLKFHENYYPELVIAVNSVREKVFKMLKDDYSGFDTFLVCYEKHICEGVYNFSKKKFNKLISYEKFVENIEKESFKSFYDNNENTVVEYYPEELNLLKRSPDAELSIIMMNEKLAVAEKGTPIIIDDYFYSDKTEFLKVILFETLLNMMNDTATLRIVKSLLIKSLDKQKGESSSIMEVLLQRLRDEGFKKDIIIKLQKKLLKKNHVTSRIKKKIAENKKWEYLVATDDPIVKLEKFSKLTGLTFFTLKGAKGTFNITATFKENDWVIGRIIQEDKK